MTENLPICEYCHFYKKPLFNDAICKKYSRYHLDDLVSHKTTREKCRQARYDNEQCGKEGKGFLKRERIKQNQTWGC